MRNFRHKISVAPMMAWTDSHERFFLRLISRKVLLFTEMITTGAIIHGDRERLLWFNPIELPLVLQLGGSEPHDMAECARMAADRGFSEVNINVGCPSDKVRSGRFGACLMLEPNRVRKCVEKMMAVADLPISIKSRIGVDDRDSYDDLFSFVKEVAKSGCGKFIVHARKALLSGLSPKENREIPPLRYEFVHRLKDDFPDLEIIINGGIRDLNEVVAQLALVDGVMLGREAYQNPYLLADIDSQFYGIKTPKKTREEIIYQFLPYVRSQVATGVPLPRIVRHVLGLYKNQPGARGWRKCLSEDVRLPGASVTVVEQAIASIVGSADTNVVTIEP